MSLFFSFFFLMGAFFLVVLTKELFAILQTYTWDRTDCVILRSEVVEDRVGDEDNPYVCSVEYEYFVNGQQYASRNYSPNGNRFSKYGEASRLLSEFPAGANATCLVNPKNPSEAILKRNSLVMGFFIILPLIFIVVGGGGIYAAWRKKSPAEERKEKSISEKAATGTGTKVGVGFFGIFFLVGAIVFYFMAVRPTIRIIAAKSWAETPCTIISSQVRSHDSDDGTTYSVDIFYRYTFNGQGYRSDRYKFLGGSSSGYDGKRDVVRSYPEGSERICYVDPEDPTQAVLERGFTADMWFGLIPLVFVAVGGGGIYFTLRGGRKRNITKALSDSSRAGSFLRQEALQSVQTGPVRLKAKTGPVGKFIASLFFAGFWNGIVSVFVVQAAKSWQRGNPEWFLTLFMIPFVLVGLFLIGLVGYCFLGLFNPRSRITVNSQYLPLGGELDVRWKIHGRAHAINKLSLFLEGREEATYRRGTNTHTDKNIFVRIPVAELNSHYDIRSGEKTILIPRDTVPTLTLSNNKIIWSLHVKGDIRRWPDISDEYDIQLVDPKSLEHP